MINYSSFTLENGLQVVVHEDPTVEIAVLNILYDVGSRDEDPDKTGFAHLFEHLMFGGSKNIPDYDGELQKVGGENNAFTSPDVTNYYITVPAQSLETAFWLESDRMLSLSFDPKVLEVQRKVVIEEFKQRYINQPYGDVWAKLRPLAYQQHPYMWPTIGKEISHIADATMDDVKGFFYKHYRPDQAVLVVAGNVKTSQVKELSEKWFGPISKGEGYKRHLPAEPVQKEYRHLDNHADVPTAALYMTFHVPRRYDEAYYPADLLSDIIGRGKSSRLYRSLVRNKKLFTQLSSYMNGSFDPGLMVIQGQLSAGVTHEEAEKAIFQVIDSFGEDPVSNAEMEKVKNQAAATIEFGEVEVLQRAMNLAFCTIQGDTEEVNRETNRIQAVTLQDLEEARLRYLIRENCSSMYYYPNSTKSAEANEN
jgi:zinc protease